MRRIWWRTPRASRIEAIVQTVGYTTDLTARGLTLQRTGLVGAVVPLLTNSLIAEIVQGLSDTLARNDYQLLIGASGFSARAEQAMIRAFLSRRVDAIYLSGINHRPSRRACSGGAHSLRRRRQYGPCPDRHGGRLLEQGRGGDCHSAT